MPMRHILICLLIVFFGLGRANGQLADEALEKLLRQSTEKSEKLLAEMESKAKVLVKNLLKALIAKAESLEQAGEQANANTVRGLVRKIETAANAIEAVDISLSEPQPLATGIHQHLVDLEDAILEINKEYAPKVARTREPVVKYLKGQLQRGRGANAANADQLLKFYDDYVSVPQPTFDDFVPVLPPDDHEAELIWVRTRKELKTSYDRDIRRETASMFVKLYDMRVNAIAKQDQVIVTRLDEIDTAFRTSESIEQAFSTKRRDNAKLSGRPDWQDPSGWLSINRKKIPSPIAEVIQSHSEWCAERMQRFRKVTGELDQRWSSRNAKKLKEVMLSDATLEVQVKEIRKHFQLMRKRPEWFGQDVTIPLPDSTPEVMGLLKAFDESVKARLEKANQQDAQWRQALVASLEQMNDANDEAEAARLELIDTLTSDYAEGIRGTLLFEASPSLSKQATSAVNEYIKKADTLRDDLAREHAKKVFEFRLKLKPKRMALIKQNDFEGALLVDFHIERRDNPIPPIWIRSVTTPRFGKGKVPYGWTSPGLLFAKGAKGLLVGTGNTPRWVSRQDVILSWKEIDETQEVVGKSILGPFGASATETKPPSQLINALTRLSIGDEVLAFKGRAWETLEIADLSPFGAVFHSTPLGSTIQPEVCPKTALRQVIQREK